uniref:Major facilitator superfamily (MFS) profile domain-containing protein n=1 Tax=Trichuris muris TaxID=70415 RepID=A0A5S6PYT7_TRIMR
MVEGLLRWSAYPEFLLYFYGIPCGIMLAILQPFVYENLCLHYSVENFDIADCQGSLNSDWQTQLEAEASIYQIYMQLAIALPGIISVLFVATWSDDHGRKLPLLFALTGANLSTLVMLLCAAIPSLSIHWMLFSQILTGLCGHCIVLSLSLAMITDTVNDSRLLTIRMGTAGGSYVFGLLTGTLLCSLGKFTYAAKFGAASMFLAFDFFYALIFLTETYQPKIEDELTCLLSTQECVSRNRICKGFNDYISTFLKPRNDGKRTYLLVSLAVFFILYMCDTGMPGVQLLFLKLPPLNFSDQKYAQMSVVHTATAIVSLTAVAVFLKRLKIHDTTLILLCIAFSICKMIVFAISDHMFMVYLASVLGGIAIAYFPAFRSFLSHMIDLNERARLFTAMALLEQIAPLISSFIFNNLFFALVSYFPGDWKHLNSVDREQEGSEQLQ